MIIENNYRYSHMLRVDAHYRRQRHNSRCSAFLFCIFFLSFSLSIIEYFRNAENEGIAKGRPSQKQILISFQIETKYHIDNFLFVCGIQKMELGLFQNETENELFLDNDMLTSPPPPISSPQKWPSITMATHTKTIFQIFFIFFVQQNIYFKFLSTKN